MKAIVLAGGLGTRLRPLTFAVPKPLLAIGEKPILQHIIEQLAASGFDDIILATGYLAELIQAYCGDGDKFGAHIRCIKESQPLGTAGPLSLLRGQIARDEFVIVMNGDIVTLLDYAKMLNHARRHTYELTVGFVHRLNQSPFGVLAIDGHGEITNIVEKPSVRQAVSGGIYVVRGSALDHIPDNQYFTIPDLIQKLRSAQVPVGAYLIKEFWQGVEDLGHMEFIREALNGNGNGAAVNHNVALAAAF
jgi:NDP-sugar pyrophosphorylase family protein